MRIEVYVLALLLLGVSPLQLNAQEAGASSRCLGTNVISCTAPRPQGREDKGQWSVFTDTDPLYDSATVTLRNDSTEGRSSFGEPITLFLRCSNGKTEAYIDWKDFLGSDSLSVAFRVGQQEARTYLWGLSTDHEATFFPRSVEMFINSLLNVDTFVARATPYNESPVTAVWDLSGLSEAVIPLRDACGW